MSMTRNYYNKIGCTCVHLFVGGDECQRPECGNVDLLFHFFLGMYALRVSCQ